MNVYIWLDDKRPKPNSPFYFVQVIHAHNYKEAIHFLYKYLKFGNIVYVDFDHDLGETKSGYDVAKWIVEAQQEHTTFRAKVLYHVHSMNPVGRANIEQLLDHYGYKRF